MLIVIAVASVILSIAVPSYQSVIASNRATTTANELVAGIRFARASAIKEGARVTLCPLAEGANECLADGAASPWTEGFMVFLDETGTTRGVREAGERVLRVSEFSAAGLVEALGAEDGAMGYISFSGQTASLSAAISRAEGSAYLVCDINRRASPRVITLLGTGWPQVLTDKSGDGAVSGIPGVETEVTCNG
jgi:type II secretory pathway pseudopilin PulG